MYKILIRENRQNDNIWLFYKKDANELELETLKEAASIAKQLIKEYGKKNVKIVQQIIDGHLEDFSNYIIESTLEEAKIIDMAHGDYLTYTDVEINKIDKYITFYNIKGDDING